MRSAVDGSSWVQLDRGGWEDLKAEGQDSWWPADYKAVAKPASAHGRPHSVAAGSQSECPREPGVEVAVLISRGHRHHPPWSL